MFQEILQQLQPLATTYSTVVLGFLIALATCIQQVTAHYLHKNAQLKIEEGKTELARAAKLAAYEVREDLQRETAKVREEFVTAQIQRQGTDEKIAEIGIQVNGRLTKMLAENEKVKAENIKLSIENKALKEELVRVVLIHRGKLDVKPQLRKVKK